MDVDQTDGPDDFSASGAWWEDVGTFTLTGDTLVVKLTDDANGYVIADAIRLELVS